MKLSKRSLLIRTNVCEVCWRAFVHMPVMAVVLAVVCVILSPAFLFDWLGERAAVKQIEAWTDG